VVVKRLGIELYDKKSLLGRINSCLAKEGVELGVVFISGLLSLLDCLKGFHCVFLVSGDESQMN